MKSGFDWLLRFSLVLYLVACSATTVWSIKTYWPMPLAVSANQSAQNPIDPGEADPSGVETAADAEPAVSQPHDRAISSTLLTLAFSAGALGACLHALQSLTVYLGNEQFKASWTAWYLLRPLIGGLLGILVYVVLRAGFIQPTAGIGDEAAASVNPYGTVAISALAGLFSKRASAKLEELVDTLFAPRDKAEDPVDQMKDKLDS